VKKNQGKDWNKNISNFFQTCTFCKQKFMNMHNVE